MEDKTVVVVEDQPGQSEPLKRALQRRGFQVEVAATVAEARRIIEILGEAIDVMVLDMILEDPDEPNMTGADIGIEVRDKHPDWMCEFVISTVHSEVVDYYRLALRLGAAAYLSKKVMSVWDVVMHVRALALKRSLRLERREVIDKLRSISESTRSLPEAVKKFCRELLAPELNACLGAPYILLLTDDQGTQNVATNTDLQIGYSSIYGAIQIMAHGITGVSMPHVVSEDDLRNLPAPVNESEAEVVVRLPSAVFLPLANVKNFRLSAALFVPREGEIEYSEDTQQLATVLAQYVSPAIVELFLTILVHLDSQKRAMLKSISDLCLYLGETAQRILDEGIANEELQETSFAFKQLATMAADLSQTGIILNSAANNPLTDDSPVLEVSELIKSAFADFRAVLRSDELKLEVEGSCRIRALRDDIEIAINHLLHWLTERSSDTPPDLQPQIHVECVERNESALVIFEDRSRRLPERLRACLFDPFATSVVRRAEAGEPRPGLYLPLYMAKVLVEEKYGGRLEDKSDDMEGKVGHRLVMGFSKSRDRSVSAAASDSR
jgi:DNA-binding NarL/FixJ family response regulator